MKFSRTLITFLTAFGGIASATVVNIDFNHSVPPVSDTFVGNGAGEIAPLNDTWNSVVRSGANVSASSLLTSTGASSLVGISLTGISNSASSLAEQEVSGGFAPLMQDFITIDSGTSGVVKTVSGVITGLIANGNYEIFFYAQGDNMVGSGPSGQNSLFTIDGTSKQTGYDGVAGGNGFLEEGKEYVKFTTTASAGGEISFNWANVVTIGGLNPGNVAVDDAPGSTNGSRYASLNAIQIVAVPEPSALLLGALGLLGLLVRRR